MTQSRKTAKAMLLSVLAAMALCGLLASGASAATAPANFSDSAVKLTTTGVTVKRAGLEAKTCTLGVPIELAAFGPQFFGGNTTSTEGGTVFNCGSAGSLTMRFAGAASYDTLSGAYSLTLEGWSNSLISPWGAYFQQNVSASWVNGSGSSASTLTFNNATIGYSGGRALTLQGTLKATTPGGGLTTLTH